MAEVLAKVCGAANPWTVQADPQGRLIVSPQADLLVQYSTGGSDTVPAGVAAAECPLDPAFVWCPYVVPSAGGTLHAVKESAIAALSGDFSILAHVHQHEVVPHQRSASLASSLLTAVLSFVLNASPCLIRTGVAGSLVVPYACTLLSCEMLADQASSIVLDIGKVTFGSYPSSTSIVAAAPPTLSAAIKSQDTTLSGWSTALLGGDILRFSVSSNDVAQELTCALLVSVP